MKSHILTANTPAQIEFFIGQSVNIAANESKPHLKCGRPVGVKDKIPQKRKVQEKEVAAYKEDIPMKQCHINNWSIQNLWTKISWKWTS